MLHAEAEEEEGVQPVYLASKNKTVNIVIHHDASTRKDVVLWDDILMVFPNALYLQYQYRAVPFLKDANLDTLNPPRVEAMPGATLEVILKTATVAQQSTTTTTLSQLTQENLANRRHPVYGEVEAALQNYTHIDSPPSVPPMTATTGRNPAYGDELVALENYLHIDPPNLSAPGLQLLPTLARPPTVFTVSQSTTPIDNRRTLADKPKLAASDKKQQPTAGTIKISARAPQVQRGSLQHLEFAMKQVALEGKRTDKEKEADTKAAAAKVTRALAEKGDAQAQLKIADSALAMKWYLKAAEQGIGEAFNNIGYLHMNGDGVPKDFSKAMEWLLKAIAVGMDEGEGQAEVNIGDIYYLGDEGKIEQDHVKAMEWFRKAAEKGHSEAQRKVGCFYELGQGGVDQDSTQAAEWFRKAAKKGNIIAMLNLGSLYEEGRGVPQDYAKALQQYTKASGKGSADAFYAIAVFYDIGLSVGRNGWSVMEYYIEAAKRGHKQAAENVLKMRRAGWSVETLSAYLRSLEE
ncbi:hypothetical protein BG015_007163 [Linnemannia schmuckeri]|uniref:HCP-like protein n=1 Tax=Linnemannia schmuckeri TaxID=64567 RepID=A0A9P5S6D7_9FUNG|nr:hypothetical protein BG015_007163 [Linnemannia schmuckeri]